MKQGAMPRRRVRGKLFFVLAAVALVLLWAESLLRPMVEEVVAYQAQLFAASAVNEAVIAELEREDNGYGQLMAITRDAAGQVNSLEANMPAINRLKTYVSRAVLDAVEQLDAAALSLPLGTLLGNELTSGRGPDVEIKLVPAGYAETELYSRFTAAGINQTNHEVMLRVTVRLLVTLPGYRIACQSESSYCVAQTVIVGEIPDTYVQFSV